MRWPFVSGARHRELIQELGEARHRATSAELRVDRLIDVIVSMRRDGFAPQHRAIVREAPDPEAIGLERAETQRRAQLRAARDAEFIQNAIKDIVARTGVDRQTAAAEAKRLLDESRAEQPAGD